MPTQQEYNVVKQINRKLYSKFEILNYKFQVVGNLEGVVVGTPSFSNDSNSNIRRTCNVQITPTNSSFDITQSGKLWIDKYVRIYIGIYDDFNDEIVYSKMGIYLINNPNHVVSATEDIITISGIDLMARMTGMRDGNLEGLEHFIPQGSNVRNVLINTLALFGFNNYIISEYPILTPYDISINVGGNGFDIINEILNILPNWQVYFDVDGIFHFEEIPSGENEQVMVDDDLWSYVLLNYSQDYDYENIKNYIEVLGKTHDSSNPCGVVTLTNDVYVATCSKVTSLVDSLIFSFTTPSSLSTIAKLNINSYGAKNIRIENGDIPNMVADSYYVVQYVSEGDYYKFLGSYQPYAISKETNPQSPFYINGTSGILRIVLSGSDYDNINSDYLAQQRAEFELYQRCRLQDNITINCVPIYWLDTNWLIEITLPNKQGKKETNKYLIKSINTTLGTSGTQSITLMRFYPYYPSV